mmetsp:Transcript_26864/g.77123  ORF Transcript_26864/g.77123 Transcript_26864/m.77123 type:complete len:562 (-) Transcript_26864:1188-2873(-)
MWFILLQWILLAVSLPSTRGAFIPTQATRHPSLRLIPADRRRRTGLSVSMQVSHERAGGVVDAALGYLKKHETPRPFVSGTSDLVPSIISRDNTSAQWSLQPNFQLPGAPFSPADLQDVYEKHASQSPFGVKDKTVVDPDVRNSREVHADQVSVRSQGGRWENVIDGICRVVEHEMTPGYRVSADFYKALIYAEGDHFRIHKDTQRNKEMFGSLLVFLPTDYSGGDFLLHDGDAFDGERFNNETRVALESGQCRWLTFLADIPHRVMPVESGHRLVLAYNLRREKLAEPQRGRPAPLAAPLQDLVDMLTDYFTSTGEETQGDREKESARRFVFLLDHDYTPSSIGPDYLKGADSALYQVLAQHFNVSFEMLNEFVSFDDPAQYSLIDNETDAAVLRAGTANITDEEKAQVFGPYWETEFFDENEFCEFFDHLTWYEYRDSPESKHCDYEYLKDEYLKMSEEEKQKWRQRAIARRKEKAIADWRSSLADGQASRWGDDDWVNLMDRIREKASSNDVDFVFPVRKPGQSAFAKKPHVMWGGNQEANWEYQYISVCLLVSGLRE